MTTRQKFSVDEALESLTGHEELDIRKRFQDADPVTLLASGERPTWALRALVYVLTMRDLKAQDLSDPSGKAFKQAMDMTIGDVGNFFDDQDDEVFPEEPVTEAGKDVAPLA